MPTLIGPFSQILTLADLPQSGPIPDKRLNIIPEGGVVIKDDKIMAAGPFASLYRRAVKSNWKIESIKGPSVLTPGLIDCHTHICFAGSRAADYAQRVSGISYLEIAKKGGGILDTVRKTRAASQIELEKLLKQRCQRLLHSGVTTCEVKSGYGLDIANEIKMLRAIRRVGAAQPVDLVATCLAAHVKPPEYSDHGSYLDDMAEHLLPRVRAENLAGRVDVFVESGAFSPKIAQPYLWRAKAMGFDLIVHADQFHRGGSGLAAKLGAVSADHLEAATTKDFINLKKSNTVAVILPGATLGLGMPFPPARQMLDTGLCVAVASDWNPGSAPMGNLLLQAALLGAAEKLTLAETWAAITYRAAKALRLDDRGIIKPGQLADLIAFPTSDWREILYAQGSLSPHRIWKRGQRNV